MNSGKYDRNINMLCPTCGGDQFETGESADEATEIVKCASCGRVLTKDELIDENSETIEEHVKEMGAEAVKDLAKEMKESIRKAFRGNKNIRIE